MFNPEGHILEVADLLVDSRVGVVARLSEIPRHAGGPDFVTFHAQACNTAGFVEQRNFGSTAGCSSKRERAIGKALGEAVERYCAAIYDRHECVMMPYNSMPAAAIDPARFALYSGPQYSANSFNFKPIAPDTPVRWTSMFDLHSCGLAYVPAAMVYVPYYFSDEEPPICQPVSTGLACHSTYERAAISSICEVIERDAFTLAWLQGLSPARVDIGSLSAGCRDLVARFERTNRHVTLLNITRDTRVPTILAVQHADDRELPAIVVAAATAPRAMEAVRKSLEELALTSHYMQTLHDVGALASYRVDPMAVIAQDDHLRFWCSHEHKHLAKFLLSSETVIRVADLHDIEETDDVNVLAALIERVHGIGYQVLLADLTTDDLVDLHLYVTKAIIPGFHPLCIGHQNRALGGPRLQQFPYWATRDDTDCPLVLNEAPHPYP